MSSDTSHTPRRPGRTRTRPTREETRAKLIEAAALLFAEQGIGDTSIEDVCTAAGFSRGAFYSNFTAKDDLVFALLDAHFDANHAEVERLYDKSVGVLEFIESMNSDERRRNLPVDDVGMLYMELTLYALRNPENRPRLLARHRGEKAIMRETLVQIQEDEGMDYPVSVDDVAEFLLAFDTGLLVHALIDPEGYDQQRWARTVTALHRIFTGELRATPPAD